IIWGGAVSGTSLTPKNTAGINIFAANTSFRRKRAKRGRKIDGNRLLHYKPRNLSAGKFRLLPGAALGGRTGPFGALPDRHQSTGRFAPGQRRTTREADLPTLETGAQAPPRLPRPSRHRRRPQGPRRAPRAGPQAPERLR